LEPKALPAVPNRPPLEAPLEAGAPKENVFDMMRIVRRGEFSGLPAPGENKTCQGRICEYGDYRY
jgi:hypothetical protein